MFGALIPELLSSGIKLDSCLWHLKELHKPEESFPKTGSKSGAATEEGNVKPADRYAPPSGQRHNALNAAVLTPCGHSLTCILHWRHLLCPSCMYPWFGTVGRCKYCLFIFRNQTSTRQKHDWTFSKSDHVWSRHTANAANHFTGENAAKLS